jgi:hypothetical protein
MNDVLWASIGLIFLTAVVSAVVRLRSRDKCLKLLRGQRVTLEMVTGRTIWGDAEIYGRGMRVEYPAAHRTPSGLVKSAYLLYEEELADLLAVARIEGALSEGQRAERLDQIDATFDPGPLRRSWRVLRNIVNTLNDAIMRALELVVGQVAKQSGSSLLAARQKEVASAGGTVLGAVGNAYEPMLEALIGQPVVLELASPADPTRKTIELSGYLAEYSTRFVAVFNVDHDPTEAMTIAVAADGSVDAPVGIEVELDERAVVVRHTGGAPLRLVSLVRDSAHKPLDILLLPGAYARMVRPDGAFQLRTERQPRLDLVCPRQYAVVRHASRIRPPREFDEVGEIVHEDERVAFP